MCPNNIGRSSIPWIIAASVVKSMHQTMFLLGLLLSAQTFLIDLLHVKLKFFDDASTNEMSNISYRLTEIFKCALFVRL